MEELNLEIVTFGAGCFWCTEAIFQSLKGVIKVESGYSGGNTQNPTYNEVASGTTGHAEIIQVTFDPAKITYYELLEIFFETHDPTSINRQGNDLGTQYRSIILIHNKAQKQTAEKLKQEIDNSKKYSQPIVTEIKQYENFYKAENYHQNYFVNNPGNPYCTLIISPKLKKLREKFSTKTKPEIL